MVEILEYALQVTRLLFLWLENWNMLLQVKNL